MKYEHAKLPNVIIFGRTNVGKSTLFNLLTERKSALVSDIEGTTRDSNLGIMKWQGNDFNLIDTGGIMDLKNLTNKKLKKIAQTVDDIDIKVQHQARDYIIKADLVLFVVDTKAGLLPDDKEMALQLKKNNIDTDKIILVCNKVDGEKQRRAIAEFNQLALGEIFPVSAATGSGTGDLLDHLVEKTKDFERIYHTEEGPSKDEILKISIIGKPNVGKSSLVNAILGEERNIVSPIPNTTREPQDTLVKYKGQIIKLIDTAGISRRGQQNAKQVRHKNTLEKFSIEKSINTLRKADIALLVLDINEEITHQESRLIEEIVNNQTSLIIVANKWDTVEERDTKAYTKNIYTTFPFVKWAPIQFTSALTGEKITKVLDMALEVGKQRKTEIQENTLSKYLQRIVKIHAPSKGKGTKHPYIYELKQFRTNPPRFSIRIGFKDDVHFSYIRFIENRIREKFGFIGTPIKVIVERNRKIHGAHEERYLRELEDRRERDQERKENKEAREKKVKDTFHEAEGQYEDPIETSDDSSPSDQKNLPNDTIEEFID